MPQSSPKTAFDSDLSDLALVALRRRPAQARGYDRVADVLNAFEALLLERRPEEITVEDVAAHAGINMGSLYFFFPHKTAIIVTLVECALAAEAAAFTLRGNDLSLSFNEYLTTLEKRMMQVWSEKHHVHEVYFSHQRHPLIWEMVLAHRETTAQQIRIKLQQLYPQLSHARALRQGEAISMVMASLVDNLAYLSGATRGNLRRSTFDMINAYVNDAASAASGG